jgi:hypothetical protein
MAPQERRQNARLPARDGVTAGVVLIEHLDILDLSLGGVRFSCTRRLSPDQRVDLVLRRDAERVSLRGKVARSTFRGSVRIDGRDHTCYEVAVAFDPRLLDERRLADLSRFMERR